MAELSLETLPCATESLQLALLSCWEGCRGLLNPSMKFIWLQSFWYFCFMNEVSSNRRQFHALPHLLFKQGKPDLAASSAPRHFSMICLDSFVSAEERTPAQPEGCHQQGPSLGRCPFTSSWGLLTSFSLDHSSLFPAD